MSLLRTGLEAATTPLSLALPKHWLLVSDNAAAGPSGAVLEESAAGALHDLVRASEGTSPDSWELVLCAAGLEVVDDAVVPIGLSLFLAAAEGPADRTDCFLATEKPVAVGGVQQTVARFSFARFSKRPDGPVALLCFATLTNPVPAQAVERMASIASTLSFP